MRGIVLKYTVLFILAMIGFYLAVRLFQTMPEKAERAGCSIIGCSDYPEMKSVQERAKGPREFAEKVLPYAAACWEKSGEGRARSDIICYEIFMPYTGGPYSESEVEAMAEDYSLGYVDAVGEIPERDAVLLVMYDSTLRKVVIK